MSAEDLPTVSVLVPSYNYGRYVAAALDSIIAQDYPFELFEVIVVNDGSSDDTEDVMAPYLQRHPERIRLINQSNSGLVASLNRAAEAAGGDLLAIFDADDVWLPQKTRRQVEMFQANPDITMVCSNMTFIDGDGNPTGERLHSHALQAAHRLPETGSFKRLLQDNFGMQSSLIFKREVFRPAPPQAVYTDWWFMLCAAYAGRIGYIAEDLALYRVHATNLTAAWRYDNSPEIKARETRRALGVKLAGLRHFDLSDFTVEDCAAAWQAMEETLWNAMQGCGTLFLDVVGIDDDDRKHSQSWSEIADEAAEAGDHESEVRAILKALSWDPFGVGLRVRLLAAAKQSEEVAEVPHPLRDAKEVVVLTDAEELIAEPGLLTAYAEAVTGIADLTLAIDATRMAPETAAAQLHALVADAGLDQREDVDMVALVDPLEPAQRHRMLSTATARLRQSATRAADSRLPEFDRESLSQLREFVTLRVAELPGSRATL